MFGLLENVEPHPITIENDFGKFTLIRCAESSFEYWGDINWNGFNIKAYIPYEIEEKGFERLFEVLVNVSDLDHKLKEYALTYILEEWGNNEGLIKIWGSEDEFSSGVMPIPITPEEFLKRLKMCSIRIFDNCSLRFGIDADNMFTDHILSIWADTDGNFTECGLTW